MDATEANLDARLAVMTGLRRWAEPGSSQMLISLATIIVAIVAIAVGVSDFDPGLFVLMLVIGIPYLVLALFGIGQALQMDDRRKMAHGWLKAIEDELNARNGDAKSRRSQLRRPWFRDG